MSRYWTIGSAADSDLVVSVPSVSGRHCRLSLLEDGYWLEDLGSTNGTYVNGRKLDQRARVSKSDAVTLGQAVPMPWPSENQANRFKSLTIGREPDNDIVVASPIVSGHHARIVWEGKPGEGIIEDLGSANGTAIQSADNPITRATFTTHDTIYLGTQPLLGSHLLACLNPSALPVLDFSGDSIVIGRDVLCHRLIDIPMVSSRHASLLRIGEGLWIEDLGSSNGTFINGVRVEGRTAVKPGDIIGLGSHCVRLAWTSVPAPSTQNSEVSAIPAPSGSSFEARFLQPAPVVSATESRTDALPWGFVETFTHLGKHPTLSMSLALLGPAAALVIALALRGNPQAVPAILFWTGFSALGLGLCNAVAVQGFAPSRPRNGLDAAAGTFCSLGLLSLIQCMLLWGMVSRLAGLEESWLAALGVLALGAGVGLAIGLLIMSLSPKPAAAIAVVLVLLGGFAIAGGGGRTPEAVRSIAGAAPTRWVYEGMLLLNADPQLAETDFPAATERMGLRADVLALALMAIGFSAAAAFISTSNRPLEPPPVRPTP